MELNSFSFNEFKMLGSVNKGIPNILIVSLNEKSEASSCIGVFSFFSPFFKFIDFIYFFIESILFTSLNLEQGIFLQLGESIRAIKNKESIDELLQSSISSHCENMVFRLALNGI
jgi:hypothetical protein